MTATTEEQAARAYPVPDEQGVFDPEDGERISRPGKGDASIQVIEQADGWRASADAELPEAVRDESVTRDCPAFSTRGAAIIWACEELVSWLSRQKEFGSKKHKRLAAEQQDWALDIAKREHAAAVPVDASVRACDSGVEDDDIPAPVVDAMRDVLREPEAGGEHEAEQGSPRSVAAEAFPPVAGQQLPQGVQLIAIKDLWESDWNPRKVYPTVALAELAESIRVNGFQQWKPIVARPREEGKWYEIAAGHRRARAAEIAGLTHVPVIVRAMSDAEFLELLNIDNAGREDIHPLHEAQGWHNWMEQTGIEAQKIAASIGKSREYVYKRLKCLDLIPQGQSLYLAGRIRESHAVLIARLTPAQQEDAIDFCAPLHDPDRQVSTRDLERWIADHCREEELIAPPAPVVVEPAPVEESEPEPPAATVPTLPAAVIDAALDKAQADLEAEAALRKQEKARREYEAQQRVKAEEERVAREQAEAKAAERARLIYRRTVEAICGKTKFPPTREDVLALCDAIIGGMEVCDEAADMYRVPKISPYSTRVLDAQRALPRQSPETMLRLTLAAILFDAGAQNNWRMNAALSSLMGARGIRTAKIEAAVDAELNPKPAPKSKTPKDVIGKLPTLNAPAKAKAKAKPAPAKKTAQASGKAKGKKK